VQSPAFSYTTPGTYDVSLTVTNSAGSTTMLMEAYLVVDKNTAAPEFPTSGLPIVLIIGMLGTILFIRRTREH